MADNVIDTLQLQIESDSRNASRSIGKLADNLLKLQKSVMGIENIKLDGFSGSMSQLKSSLDGFSVPDGLEKGINTLYRLSRINSAKMLEAAIGVKEISDSLQGMKGITIPTLDGVDKLIESTRKLGGVKIGDASKFLPTISKNLVEFVDGMNKAGSVTFDFSNMEKLISSISALGGAKSTQAAANLKPIKEQILEFVKGLNGIKTIDFDVSGLTELVSSISKLGGKASGRSAGNINAITDALSRMMSVLSKSPRVSENVIRMTNAMANLATNGAKVGSAARGINSSFNMFGASAGKAAKKSHGLAATIGRLYATFWVLQRGVSAAGRAIQSSMDFIESYNYFDVALSKVGRDAADNWEKAGYESAEAYAESFKDRMLDLNKQMTGFEVDESGYATYTNVPNLGMNPQQVLNYSAMYAQMADSMGMTGEAALKTSKALVMLGADWASLRNISLDTAWGKFASALAGETEAIRQLGLDITQTTLQQTAYKYGLDMSIQSMDRATKTQLMLLSVLDQSKVAFGDMARTIESPANQLRLFQQNIANLARTIGNLFLPIVSKVLPYVNGLIIALQRLFALLGLKINIKDSIGQIGGGGGAMGDFAGSADDAADALGEAADNAKKLKNYTLGIDELNIIAPPESSGGGAGGAGGGGLLDDAIGDALAEYESIWDQLLKNNKAQEIADKIYDFFMRIAEVAKPTTEALKTLWDEGLAKLAGFAWDTLGDFYREFLVPVGKWTLGDNAGLPRLIYILNDMLNNIDWGRLRNSLFDLYRALADLTIVTFDAVFDFFDYFLAPLATWTMSSAIPQLLDIMTRFIKEVDWNKINSSLEKFWKALEPFAENIGQGIINFFSDLAKIGAKFINFVVPNGLELIANALNMMSPEFIQKIGYALGGLLTTILGFKVIRKVQGYFDRLWVAIGGKQAISDVKSAVKHLGNFAETVVNIPHVIITATKALQGNQGAVVALSGLYPKLDKSIKNVSKTFEYFKSAANSGNFFGTINNSLKNIVGNMSAMQRSAMTAVSAFFEFTIIKDTMYGLQTGTEGFLSAIAKISGVAAAAGYAMYLAFGPAGIVIAAITGVVAAISGISKAMDEVVHNNASQAIADALSNPGGQPIASYSDQYIAAFSEISAQFDSIAQKSQEMQSVKGNVDQANESIGTFVFAMKNGATVTDAEVNKIVQKFQQLVTDSQNLFSQQAEIIMMGLAGSLGEAVEAAGGSVEEYIKITSELQTETQKALSEISKDIQQLTVDYENGVISQDAYVESLGKLYEKYAELTGYGEDTKKSVENLQGVVAQGLDLSSFTLSNGELDKAALSEYFSKVADSASEAKSSVEENGQLMIDAIQSAINKANELGKTEDANALGKLLEYQKKDIEVQIGEIDKLVGTYTQTIQDQLIGKSSEVANNAIEEWEKLDFYEKIFVPKEGQVSTAISQFNDNFIAPLNSEISSKFGEFGEYGKAYASDAMGTILDGLVEVDSSSSNPYERAGKLTSNIESLVKTGIDGAKEGIESLSSEMGGFTVEGYNKGIEDNQDTTDDIIMTWMKRNLTSMHDSPMEFGSPSEAAKRFGKDTVVGYNIGIQENASSTSGIIKTWMESVKSAFAPEQWATAFSNILPAFQQSWTAVTEWWNGAAIPEFFAAMTEGAFSLENWLLMFDNMKLGMQQKWLEITTWWTEEALPTWWKTGVEEYFNEKRWMETLENVRKAFDKKWEEIDKLITKRMDEILEKTDKKLVVLVETWEESLNLLKEMSHNTFVEIKNDATSAIDEIIEKIGEAMSKVSELSSSISGLNNMEVSISGARARVRGFAGGGMPEMGELFVARENGPEFVGSFGSRTAVANNDQIVQGITNGVYAANMEIVSVLNEVRNLLSDIKEKDMSISLDGRELISGIDERRSRNGFSF